MENEKINKYENILFAKYSNFSRSRNSTVKCSSANNAIKVGKHSRKYVILIFSLFFRFFIQVEYIWLSCFVLYCTTLRELFPFAKNLVPNILQEWNFANCALTSFLTVGFKVLFNFCDCSEKSIKHFFFQTYFVNVPCAAQRYTLYSYKC